jgi:hypothetical protein
MMLSANPSCKRYRAYYPDITPVIYAYATNGVVGASGKAGAYNVVTVYGFNFYPNDVTKVDFIGPNKVYSNIEYVYYTNRKISFIVPIDAFEYRYYIQIKNVNYRLEIPDYLYSDKLPYEIIR